ncbi:hypothetical protein SAMN05878482_10131 [Peribacillus simplex]|uniref:Uncharacterized protein n=1 Tax=Peribacillus simplex TaxID=1478 RepID=A0A9X8R158_9BACI|nr:hypothetical protein SAMN05878482_10131 [Peribacillus simplex]
MKLADVLAENDFPVAQVLDVLIFEDKWEDDL